MTAAAEAGPGTPALEALRRWERSGGVWRVLARDGAEVRVALLTCTASQEMDRIVSDDPELLAFIGERTGSDE
jgi:hypothetical protein